MGSIGGLCELRDEQSVHKDGLPLGAGMPCFPAVSLTSCQKGQNVRVFSGILKLELKSTWSTWFNRPSHQRIPSSTQLPSDMGPFVKHI